MIYQTDYLVSRSREASLRTALDFVGELWTQRLNVHVAALIRSIARTNTCRITRPALLVFTSMYLPEKRWKEPEKEEDEDEEKASRVEREDEEHE
ncbi:hypothetical protein V1477_020601 [Vespula maculifrons]|uniref:Uncharacterized protein n=1 Tax=Vespula maculifrons TaxID=7453 RepID=A0ABD2AMD9_VESMC